MDTDQKIIKNKVGLLNLAQMLGSVSQACKMMGYSRESFYRFTEMYDKGGELALQEISRRKPFIKNRVEEHIEKSIVELAVEKPALGQVRVSNELAKRGMMYRLAMPNNSAVHAPGLPTTPVAMIAWRLVRACFAWRDSIRVSGGPEETPQEVVNPTLNTMKLCSGWGIRVGYFCVVWM